MKFVIDNSKSKKVLGMSYTDLEITILDMANQLIKLGLVKKQE